MSDSAAVSAVAADPVAAPAFRERVTLALGRLAPRPARRWPAVVSTVLAAALLATYAAMAVTASLSKGVSFDEALQLAVGYNLWLNDDYRMEGANGDLVKRWATLPYLVSRPNFVPRDDPAWKESLAYDLGTRFLFRSGNAPEVLLLEGRAMIALLGVATGWLVFCAARALFGVSGGLISLTLFVFNPSMLAFGGVVSTDMSITLTLFAATGCTWRLLHVVTPGRVLLGLAVVGALVLAKPTALVVLPITAVMIAVRAVAGPALEVRGWGWCWRTADRGRQMEVFAVLTLLHVLAGWAAIWAHYGFRYEASPNPADPALKFLQPWTRDEMAAPFASLLAWIERTHFLPEGFRRGIDLLLGCDDRLGAFMDGEWKVDGWPTFFPYAIWVKTPPALFVLLALAVGVWWWLRRRATGDAPAPASPASRPVPAWYAATPHFALIGCYLGIAMTENVNIGHRHVLPIYPALFVLAGAAALVWRRLAWARWVTGAALVASIADATMIRPHYLAYFGPQAGGPENGYRRLVDSSLDWGMDLPALKLWFDRHAPSPREPKYLAYFGTDRPEYYGLHAAPLPGFRERRNFEIFPFRPGYYAISASLLQGVYTAAFGPWCPNYEAMYQKTWHGAREFEAAMADPARRLLMLRHPSFREWMNSYETHRNLRFARLCAWLRRANLPAQQVGYSIFIWKLDAAALDAALLGPPPELGDTPGTLLRQFRRL